MIESGGWAVYEAIVRRKSRVAIWRDRGPQARGRTHERTPPAEISACARREFRNLGHASAAEISADETNPLESTACEKSGRPNF
ncbi:TPA: hypothetical protein QDA90_003435 [Burkholderia vietnamiensis]|nr:hypothetical protein [Burkholderia vietnamiensis]